jgi:hypothetical protein
MQIPDRRWRAKKMRFLNVLLLIDAQFSLGSAPAASK